MNRLLIAALGLLACGQVFAADTNKTDAVKAAVTKLKGEANYSWTANTEIANFDFTPGPLEGQCEKGGYMMVSQDMGGNSVQAAFKGARITLKMQDEWELFDENGEQNMGTFIARTKSAGDEAADVLDKISALKAGTNNLWSGDLTAAGAKELMSFGRRPAGDDGPKNAKASAKFWVKDGALTKYQVHMTGSVNFGGDDRDMDITRTTEIHDVGKTKVAVPDAAKKQLDAK